DAVVDTGDIQYCRNLLRPTSLFAYQPCTHTFKLQLRGWQCSSAKFVLEALNSHTIQLGVISKDISLLQSPSHWSKESTDALGGSGKHHHHIGVCCATEPFKSVNVPRSQFISVGCFGISGLPVRG